MFISLNVRFKNGKSFQRIVVKGKPDTKDVDDYLLI